MVKFLKSAVNPEDWPPADRPEVVLVGRSNAGKSSFLNAISKTKIAKVSQAAGKTRTLNFFDYGQHYRIVDMPGYGYASRSGSEQNDWQAMIENYLLYRPTLAGIVLLSDVRRSIEVEEEMMWGLATRIQKPILLVATKADTLNQKEKQDRMKYFQSQKQWEVVFFVSSTKSLGVEQVEDHIFKKWIKKS